MQRALPRRCREAALAGIFSRPCQWRIIHRRAACVSGLPMSRVQADLQTPGKTRDEEKVMFRKCARRLAEVEGYRKKSRQCTLAFVVSTGDPLLLAYSRLRVFTQNRRGADRAIGKVNGRKMTVLRLTPDIVVLFFF